MNNIWKSKKKVKWNAVAVKGCDKPIKKYYNYEIFHEQLIEVLWIEELGTVTIITCGNCTSKMALQIKQYNQFYMWYQYIASQLIKDERRKHSKII